MAVIPLVPSVLAAIVLETLFYGVYIVVFSFSVRTIVFDRHRTGPKLHSLRSIPNLIGLAMFASITARWVIDVSRLFDAFVYNSMGSPVQFYSVAAEKGNVAKTFLYVSQAIMGDFMLVYRLYYVYNRSWLVCALPSTTTLAAFIGGFGGAARFSIANGGASLYEPVYARWIVPGYTLSATTNIYCSTLLGWRIYHTLSILRDKRFGRRVSVAHIVEIIIQSAVIYTQVPFLVTCYLAQSNLFFPIWDLTSPTIGLVFCLIIVRVRLSPAAVTTIGVGTSVAPSHQMNPISFLPRDVTTTTGDNELERGNTVTDFSIAKGSEPVSSEHSFVRGDHVV
ncbi:hypothetical protein K488DRAFT_89375 [Vararia minispora EC-137]|uniref:Uncharacterized protein n=1 Tax=Vararia minispora EC-137 TaxID=1314806 RepID=A0ACB8QAP5_9AGAM|nr:hypothetical protein K488DRAFT_89375 [Vararia minispora EC-137]